jgi:hypothetical protein
MRSWLVSLGCLALAATTWCDARGQEPSDASSKASRAVAIPAISNADRPVLAIAGRTSCSACQGLKRRIQSDVALQSVLANYTTLYFDVDQPSSEYRQWQKNYPTKAEMLPILYVVRSDGAALYSGTAPSAALTEFLMAKLQECGPQLSQQQKQQMADAVTAAKALVADDKPVAAAARLQRHLGTGSFEPAAVEVEKLWSEIESTLTESIETADRQLSSDTASTSEEGVSAAAQLLEISRMTNKSMPEIARQSKRMIAQHKKSPELRDVFKHAELIAKADALEVKNSKQARAAYQAVIDKYPDTPVADLAAERLARLEHP